MLMLYNHISLMIIYIASNFSLKFKVYLQVIPFQFELNLIF